MAQVASGETWIEIMGLESDRGTTGFKANQGDAMINLGQRFTDAVDYARVAHAGQVRKGSGIPYLYHLLAVSSLVLEYGGDEDQAIAGLLHDVIEDCGEQHDPILLAKFGQSVIEIVRDCTDGTEESKKQATSPEEKQADWWNRKLKYLEHLRKEPDRSLLVSGCDKLHNARAIIEDLQNPDVGIAVFDRFTAGRQATLRYYESISRVLAGRRMPMSPSFDRLVELMHQLAGESTRLPLEHEV